MSKKNRKKIVVKKFRSETFLEYPIIAKIQDEPCYLNRRGKPKDLLSGILRKF